MPRIPGPLSKGNIFRKIDRYMSNPQQHFIDDLKKTGQLHELGEQRGILEGQEQLDHTSRELFGGADDRVAWFPDAPHKHEIIQQGYVKATELALQSDPPKPVVTYWVNGLSNFEVMVGQSDAQVTVFLLTPEPPPAKLNTRPHVDDDLWLISSDARLAAIQEEYIPEERPKAEAVADGVSCMRIRSPA